MQSTRKMERRNETVNRCICRRIGIFGNSECYVKVMNIARTDHNRSTHAHAHTHTQHQPLNTWYFEIHLIIILIWVI